MPDPSFPGDNGEAPPPSSPPASSSPPPLSHLPAPSSLPRAAAAPGTPTTHVGKYTLYEVIGEGAFGKVKLGVNRETNERVAVKIMDKKEIREQDLSAQVRREIYIMRSLTHRHIVRMHEVLTSNTKLYIVMELVTGGELFERLEKHGRVDESLARRYFQQLVDGVNFCHKNGVAHRDLKPENLLLDEEGNIRITDFGFSSMKSADVNAGLLFTQCGTPDYCAPEIIERAEDGYNGAKVDVWSCGVILFALLAGRLPFCHDETEQLYDLITSCHVTYPSFLSPGAKDLLTHMLVRDPAKRFALAEIKHHPWFLVEFRGDDMKKLVKPAFYNKSASSVHRSRNPAAATSTLREGEALPDPSAALSPVEPQAPPPAAPGQPSSATTDPAASAAGHALAAHTPTSGPRGGEQKRDAKPETARKVLPASAAAAPPPAVAAAAAAAAASVTAAGPAGQPVAAKPNAETQRPQLTSSPLSNGRVAALVRAREFNSTPGEGATGGESATAPPPQSVFTEVLDRPATPASSRSKKVSAGAQTSETSRTADQGATHTSRPASRDGKRGRGVKNLLHAVASLPTVSGSKANSDERYTFSTAEGCTDRDQGGGPDDAAARYDDQELGDDPACPPGGRGHLNNGAPKGRVGGGGAAPTGPERIDEDAESLSSDEVEDYRNKPVPVLSLPNTERFVRHQTAQDIRMQQLRHQQQAQDQQLQQQNQHRHRSDTHVRVASSTSRLPQGSQQAPPQLASTHMRRANSPSAAAVGGAIGGRAQSPFRRSVGVSPSPPAVEGRGSILAGRHLRYSDSPRQGTSPVSTSSGEKHPGAFRLPAAAAATTVPWHDSNAVGHNPQYGGVDMAVNGGDESAWFSGTTPEALSLRMWNVFLGWRASLTDEPMSPHASPELRMEHRAIQGAVAAMANPEAKLAVYEQFMSLFAKHGLGVVSGGQAGQEEAEELERSSGSLRRMPTDLSSEDDGGWSPTIYEPARNKSDLSRRREMSDLLTKWIRKYSGGSVGGAGSGAHTRENSTDGPFGGSEDGGLMDIVELQRLMRQHHGGRDDSALAEEVERLMRTVDHVEASGESPLYATGTSSRPPDGPGTRWSVPTMEMNAIANGGNMDSRNGRLTPQSDHPENAGDAANPGSRPAGAPPVSGAGFSEFVPNGSQGTAAAAPAGRRGGRRPDTATSMGLDDVEYYGSDRRVLSTKLKGVLTQMKARNQRMVESTTLFQSSQKPESIIEILCVILNQMGGHVTLKKETKRKLKVALPMSSGVLYAVIELTVSDDGLTTVNFSRSRQDRGRTDTMSFTHFYDTVRQQFIAEVQAKSRPRTQRRNRGDGPSSSSKRKSVKRDEMLQQEGEGGLAFSEAQPSGDFLHSLGPVSAQAPHSWSRTAIAAATRVSNGPLRTAPRAASDMR